MYVERRLREKQAQIFEAAHTSETSVDIQLRTQQYIPDDSDFQRQTSFSL
jgi:hypothetical protein